MVKTGTVTSPSAPTSVSVMSYDGTLLSDMKQVNPVRSKLSPHLMKGTLPNRPKGPVRANSTSSLDKISEEKKDYTETLKSSFVQGVGWASQVCPCRY